MRIVADNDCCRSGAVCALVSSTCVDAEVVEAIEACAGIGSDRS